MRLIVCIMIMSFSIVAQKQKPNAVVLISIPKCGTHLLSKCAQLIAKDTYVSVSSLGTLKSPIMSPQGNHPCTAITPAMNNYLQILDPSKNYLIDAGSLSHLPYTDDNADILKNEKFANFLMIRDPRDQVVSFAHWKKRPNSGLYPLAIRQLDFDTLCLDLIAEGKSNFPVWQCNIVDFYAKYLKWMNLDNFCLVKFESLVGLHGGGSSQEQLDEIKKIAYHMGIELDDSKAAKVATQLFGNSYTFRSGQIGAWRKELKGFHVDAFKAIPGALELLVNLGYEKDFSWAQ